MLEDDSMYLLHLDMEREHCSREEMEELYDRDEVERDRRKDGFYEAEGNL